MFLSHPHPSFRNAITDLSITPVRPKTSSVPLDGKVFRAATLDAELATELEGATIFEGVGSKDSYVMEGEAQCTGTRGKEGKAVDNLSMLTSY